MISQKLRENINYVMLSLVLIFMFSSCQIAFAGMDTRNTVMMESTFKVEGPSKKFPGKTSTGTMFIIGRPVKNSANLVYSVMVTAAHVLDDIAGDDAIVYLRKKETDGTFKKMPLPIKIRINGKDIFTRHGNADVVALYLPIPRDFGLSALSTDLFANDAIFNKYEIHPGDELLSLGYPFTVEANEAGFPILRSGKIASYPITPAKDIKTFLFDFRVFPGNSGGPVYMHYVNRPYNFHFHEEEIIFYIAGLVSQQWFAASNGVDLGLAVIVPAQFILETVNMLPDRE